MILPGIFAGIAVALKEFMIAVLLLVIAGLLLLRTGVVPESHAANT